MAFTNVQKTLTTSEETIYTAPVGNDSIIFSGIISNIDSDNEKIVYVTVKLTQDSTTTFILNNVPIIFGGSLSIPKLVVKENGKVIAFASTEESNSLIDITLSILEQAKN